MSVHWPPDVLGRDGVVGEVRKGGGSGAFNHISVRQLLLKGKRNVQ